MLDIKFIRENKKLVIDNCKKRNCSVDIEEVLKLDENRRSKLTRIEEIRAQKNKVTKQIQNSEDKQKLISSMGEIDKEEDVLTKEFKEADKKLIDLMYKIPNILDKDVPLGKDDSENKVLRKSGKIPKFSFKIKDHMELGEDLDIIDKKSASVISGARFTYIKKELALLQYAMVQYAFDVLTDSKIIKKIAKKHSGKTFIPIIPPVMIKPDVYTKMARLSEEDKDERYYLSQDDMYLIGSAEHTLGPIHMDQILLEKDLPIRYVGYSTCFRREAGSYGKDTKGILRLHQFDKVEMESFTTKEDSVKEQDFFVAIQEYLVKSLKIPYQVVFVCSGDTGSPDARQIDIECWMPGEDKYRETHSADLMTDYQSRRLNTRVKRKNGDKEFVHMNDATVFAIGRMLIAIIENYQQKDGSIKVPNVLQKYTGFKVIK